MKDELLKETFLFDKIIFGPVRSRRLGISLGVNLLPTDSKLCNFNCIYCECGWTGRKGVARQAFHKRIEVRKSLVEALAKMQAENIPFDMLTFAGNGEPTMHPEFARIIDDTIAIRNRFAPGKKIAVLTNASMLNRNDVVDALRKVELRILKLDAGTEEMFQKINQPHSKRSVSWVVDHLQYFHGDLIVQSIFFKGSCDGVPLDNTTDDNVNAWLQLLEKIKPRQVMIYTIDRATPEKGLEKISREELERIAARVRDLGIIATVS